MEAKYPTRRNRQSEELLLMNYFHLICYDSYLLNRHNSNQLTLLYKEIIIKSDSSKISVESEDLLNLGKVPLVDFLTSLELIFDLVLHVPRRLELVRKRGKLVRVVGLSLGELMLELIL